jgi:hypothetical protein
MLKSERPSKTDDREDDLVFSGYGSAAYMSPKEPAIKLLSERYGETFALTKGTEERIHLFLIKIGLWSLVYTFTPRDLTREGIEGALDLLEKSLADESALRLKLDESVQKALERIKGKAQKFGATLE